MTPLAGRRFIRYAPIFPTAALTDMAEEHFGTLFALGQEILRDEAYAAWYRHRARQGSFIMVDNGAAERDTPPFSDIVKAANSINAAEIILPDVLEDCDETVAQTTSLHALNLVAGYRRMIVPQGRDWEEWTYCLKEIDRRLRGNYASIGIAKHTERYGGGRREALLRIVEHNLHRNHAIHLLGAYRKPMAEIRSVLSVPGVYVRSFDSGCAVSYAQNNQRMTDGEWFSLNWAVKPDPGLVRTNIATLRRVCEGYDVLDS